MKTDFEKLYETQQILDKALREIEVLGELDDKKLDELVQDVYDCIDDKESYLSYKLHELNGE